jgi:hypothetical protein
MKNFRNWLEEKKKSSRQPMPTTPTSAPLRGQNQDYSGCNCKNNVADYTISDETVPDSWEQNTPAKRIKTVKDLIKLNTRHGAVHMPHSAIKEEEINELSPELVGKVNKARTVGGKPSKTDVAKRTLQKAVNKAWVKTKVGVVKEMIAGVGANRIKPVNMGQTTGGQKKEPNAPSNVNRLQAAANSRVSALDQAAQKQKELQQKNKEDEIKRRQAAAKKNQSE